ncbi:hypothetical protein ACH4U6_04890 [Streptomyces netropsis]
MASVMWDLEAITREVVLRIPAGTAVLPARDGSSGGTRRTGG